MMRTFLNLLSDVGPIFRAAARRRSSFLFIVVEVALGLAGVAMCVEVSAYLLTVNRPSGADIERVVVVHANRIGPPGPTDAGAREAILTRLRALDGVEAVAQVDIEPFNMDRASDFVPVPNGDPTAVWSMTGSEGILDTLGLRVAEGRAFEVSDYAGEGGSAVISRELAGRLSPDRSAVGQSFTLSESRRTATIVGVVDEVMLKPAGYPDAAVAAIFAETPAPSKISVFLLRGREDPLERLAAAARAAATDDRHIATTTLLAEQYHLESNESAGAVIAGGVAVAMLIIILLGWTGTISFLVAERTRQIGVRRALGATRGDVMRYFLLENVVVTTVGICAGIPLVVALYWFTAPKLGLTGAVWVLGPLGAGMALFWLTGLLAAALPARRASLVPPIAATRSL